MHITEIRFLSQICYLGFSFKNRVTFGHFLKLNFLDFPKTEISTSPPLLTPSLSLLLPSLPCTQRMHDVKHVSAAVSGDF